MNIIEVLKDRIQGKAPKGARRSSQWRRVREAHLVVNPRCKVCDGLHPEVHHIIPFHLAPDKELDLDNLLSLCENKKYGINCHLLIGHVGNYRRTNPSCYIDAIMWREKLK